MNRLLPLRKHLARLVHESISRGRGHIQRLSTRVPVRVGFDMLEDRCLLSGGPVITEFPITGYPPARPIGHNQTGRLDRLRNTKRLAPLQSCPV